MADLIDEMGRASAARVAVAEQRLAHRELRARALDAQPPTSLVLSAFDLIAECKLRAPSVGSLGGGGVDRVVAQARTYEQVGAAAISVLTEPDRFDGDLSHLAAVSAAVATPTMRKDFLVDPYQIWEARLAGASGVLLIVRQAPDSVLAELRDAAAEAGLFLLLEAFDEADLERAGPLLAGWTGAQPALVGVNSRDLRTLRVVPDRLTRLAPLLPSFPAVAESGMATPEDIASAVSSGYRLALVGSALMSAEDPARLAAAMLAAGRSACS